MYPEIPFVYSLKVYARLGAFQGTSPTFSPSNQIAYEGYLEMAEKVIEGGMFHVKSFA